VLSLMVNKLDAGPVAGLDVAPELGELVLGILSAVLGRDASVDRTFHSGLFDSGTNSRGWDSPRGLNSRLVLCHATRMSP
jgi:hypothetical protein